MNEVRVRDQPFRFFDNREKYLLFVTTCNEKQVIAERIARDLDAYRPVQPALRIFDAGMGDATVLTRVMKFCHHRFPTVPVLAVAKEISEEDVRIGLEKMPERFEEHPLTVLAITNMFYSEAPWLFPRSKAMQAKVRWLAVPLKGDSSYEFAKQITDLEPFVRDGWQTKASESTGNPLYVTPTVIVMYREDHAWPLTPAIPIQGAADLEYDLVIAAQPYRARMPARSKVKNVLNPLARSLAPNGRMAVFQATGRDPGMEVIRRIWPDEDPFRANRHAIVAELKTQLADLAGNLEYIAFSDEQAEFTYSLHTSPSGPAVNIGTSTLLAAWNAATYVAQIEDERIREALADGKYLHATLEVLTEHDGLWFADESFSVRRTSH